MLLVNFWSLDLLVWWYRYFPFNQEVWKTPQNPAFVKYFIIFVEVLFPLLYFNQPDIFQWNFWLGIKLCSNKIIKKLPDNLIIWITGKIESINVLPLLQNLLGLEF